jgi:hypothetical protein
METPNHILRFPNIHTWQIASNCLVQMKQIHSTWKVPAHLTTSLLTQVLAWTSDEPIHLATQIATNHEYIRVLQTQACISWGQFFKGFCTTEIQNACGNQNPNTGKIQNSDKHGHTLEETNTHYHPDTRNYVSIQPCIIDQNMCAAILQVVDTSKHTSTSQLECSP